MKELEEEEDNMKSLSFTLNHRTESSQFGRGRRDVFN